MLVLVPPPVLTLVGPEVVWMLTASAPVPLFKLVVVADAVLWIRKVLPRSEVDVQRLEPAVGDAAVAIAKP